MIILIVGSGGREHAITWRLANDEEKHELYCVPGNAGTAAIATNIALQTGNDLDGIVEFAKAKPCDLVVIGPEAPLVEGLADKLAEAGIPAFGPVAAGARMEGSKSFAKEIMKASGVPTAKAEIFTDPAEAKNALPSYGLPVVIKADGLAAGKGVVVAETLADAESAIDDMLVNHRFGESGAEILIEEFLHGEECSILAMTDGEEIILLPPSQDHKRIFDGDKGPNTGGMGAYAPAPVVTKEMLPTIEEKIIRPVIDELKKRGVIYRGILYAGLMITPDGGKIATSGSRINVVEFNARFGDPETEAVLPLIGGDFAKALLNAATGKLGKNDISVLPRNAATVILASKGYPGSYEKHKEITGLQDAATMNDTTVFHCGTVANEYGKIFTNGGRVLSVTGAGATLREAVDKAYAAIGKIEFEGKTFRKDIAHRAL